MRHRLFYHVVWTTIHRSPCIGLPLAEFLSRYLPAVVLRHEAVPLAIGIVTTHVHLLIKGAPTTCIPLLIKSLKAGSSRVARRDVIEGGELLRWARGYSISSISASRVPSIRDYVLGQPRHHPAEAIPGWVPPRLGYDLPAAIQAA